MPQRKKNVVLPVMAALALVLMFWLVFRDHTAEPAATKNAGATEAHRDIAATGVHRFP